MQLPKSKLIKHQVKGLLKTFTEDNKQYKIEVKLRYDDSCNNGHNTFSMTGTIYEKRGVKWIDSCGGCIHEEIIKHFPELQPLVKWHLTSSDMPMHYIANTVYLAGNKDCWGLTKGQPKTYKTTIFFDSVPIGFSKYSEKFCKFLESCENFNGLHIEEIEHKKEGYYNFAPKYTFSGFCTEWYQCPFDSLKEAEDFLQALKTCKVIFKKEPDSFGEGKERELDAARKCAIWPDATDAELMSDNLPQLLTARLPQLMHDFKNAMESLDFIY